MILPACKYVTIGNKVRDHTQAEYANQEEFKYHLPVF
jgi:hypothetical protein